MYQDKHEYNVIKGVIPDFGYDVKFAIKVDDNKATEIPDRKTKEGNYYKVEADCGENTKAEWDYNAWNLKVDNIKSNSKCNLTFTSNLSEADYKKYIEAGIEYRRNTYRGKDITNYKNLDSKDEMNLYNQIKNCTFDDIYVGDYIESETMDSFNKKIIWLIADINNYRYSGDTSLNQCHATIIPARQLPIAKMNTENTTAGGYYNSYMVQNVLGTEINEEKDDILNKYIVPDFKDHIIKYRNLLSNAMDSARSNQVGKNSGASSNWDWYDRYLDLMSEVNVYGSTIWSSSGYDIGIDNRQYAIFALKPEFINSYGKERFNYWLKAVTSSEYFAYGSYSGDAAITNATFSIGVRPRFLID